MRSSAWSAPTGAASRHCCVVCTGRCAQPGVVRLDGDDVRAMDSRAAARVLAVLPQESSAEFDFTVAEVVAMGRLPHRGRTADLDQEICAEAMNRTGITRLADRGLLALSGGGAARPHRPGPRQRPKVLVLDEP